MKIFVDPRANIVYSSFYIQGLVELFGKNSLCFEMKPFSTLIQNKGIEDFDQYFSFIIQSKKGEYKICIDYRDKSNLNINALKWCDVYGKVNFNRSSNDYIIIPEELKNRIIPIGPNFGIKIWNTIQTIEKFISNYFKCYDNLPVNFRAFFSGYHWQIKRNTIDFYQKSKSDSNYVFHVSSLYKNLKGRENTNSWRAEFIRSCKNNTNCNFEGGLLIKSLDGLTVQYKDIITRKYFPPLQYIENIKKSAFVFNTPAIWNCHGWKLGEYLALGKAIISTPFINEMPEPMINGENILFVTTEKELSEAVDLLLKDHWLRAHLENGARKYYEKWLEPKKVIKRLLNKCIEEHSSR